MKMPLRWLAAAASVAALLWACSRAGDVLGGRFLNAESIKEEARLRAQMQVEAARAQAQRQQMLAVAQQRQTITVRSSGTLRLSVSQPVKQVFPPDDPAFVARANATPDGPEKRALLNVYATWKRTHSGPVAPYIALYAPDAQIHQLSSTAVINRDALQRLAESTRASKHYDQITDSKPPRVSITGDTAELRAFNRYGNSADGTALLGRRRLVWRKIDGAWRIAEDWFPDSYQSEVMPPKP